MKISLKRECECNPSRIPFLTRMMSFRIQRSVLVTVSRDFTLSHWNSQIQRIAKDQPTKNIRLKSNPSRRKLISYNNVQKMKDNNLSMKKINFNLSPSLLILYERNSQNYVISTKQLYSKITIYSPNRFSYKE